MEHKSAVHPTAVVAQRIREVRRRRDLTAQQLADRLQGAGIPWDRATVTKVETGRRQNVTLVEVLALAHVLGVAPVHLVVPLDECPYQVTPGGKTPEGETVPPVIQEAERVREWIRGEQPLPGSDLAGLRTFRAEVPLDELSPSSRVTHEYIKSQLAEAEAQGRPSMADADLRERGEDA